MNINYKYIKTMIKAFDRLKNPLSIGDMVIYGDNESNLELGRIKNITKENVIIELDIVVNGEKPYTKRRSHYKVIKYV